MLLGRARGEAAGGGELGRARGGGLPEADHGSSAITRSIMVKVRRIGTEKEFCHSGWVKVQRLVLKKSFAIVVGLVKHPAVFPQVVALPAPERSGVSCKPGPHNDFTGTPQEKRRISQGGASTGIVFWPVRLVCPVRLV